MAFKIARAAARDLAITPYLIALVSQLMHAVPNCPQLHVTMPQAGAPIAATPIGFAPLFVRKFNCENAPRKFLRRSYAISGALCIVSR